MITLSKSISSPSRPSHEGIAVELTLDYYAGSAPSSAGVLLPSPGWWRGTVFALSPTVSVGNVMAKRSALGPGLGRARAGRVRCAPAWFTELECSFLYPSELMHRAVIASVSRKHRHAF